MSHKNTIIPFWVKLNRSSWAKNDAKRDVGLVEPDDVLAYKNISYGEFGEYNLLDVYTPKSVPNQTKSVPDQIKSAPNQKLPVLINVHGGGFFYGDKELYRFYAMDMVHDGFCVVNINYRLSPEHHFPAPLIDINNVLCWIEAHADEYGMDLSRVFMMGDSAGAQLTSHFAALNSNPEFAALYEGNESLRANPDLMGSSTVIFKEHHIKLAGISLACGNYGLLARYQGLNSDPATKNYLGKFDRKNASLLDELSAITADYPPAFVFSCPNDFLYNACEPMYNLINGRGGKAVMKIYGTKEMTDVGHVFHCNMKTEIGAQARRDQAEFLLNC